jgi:SSS family solute:Na+ symporter
MAQTWQYLIILLTLAGTAAVGLATNRFPDRAADFTTGGGRFTTGLVMGALTGAFIGGTCTIGTAEAAFRQGLAGLWFTLGGGAGCLALAALAGTFRAACVDTLPQFLAAAYGTRVKVWAALYTIIGMFIQIGTQLLATVPLLSVLFHLPPPAAAAVATLLMVAYLIRGGFWSSGVVGLVKMSLLAAGILSAGLTAFRLLGGWPGVLGTFPAFPWLSLWPEGVPEGLADGFSVVVGLFSTQTYVSALLAARDTATARRGFVVSALLIVAVGLAGVAVGLFMRAAAPSLRAAEALPAFLLGYCPAWLGGLALAALLISLITTGAGLTMGIATIFMEDLYPLLRPRATERQKLAAARVLILLIGGAAFSFTLAGLNTTIFHWAFLSMALRGVTVFVPLLTAVLLGPRVPPVAGRAAVILAPPLVLVWGLVWPAGPDPLYPGLAASLLILLAAGLLTRRDSRTPQQGHEPDHR